MKIRVSRQLQVTSHQPPVISRGKKNNRGTGALGHRGTDKGQTTLELTAALILVMALLAGSVKVFIWLNERMVRRQIDYENTRVAAANAPQESVTIAGADGVTEQGLKIADATGGTEVLPDESSYPALDIFGKLK